MSIAGGEMARQTGCQEARLPLGVPECSLGQWEQGFWKGDVPNFNDDGMDRCQYCSGPCIGKGWRRGAHVLRCKSCGRYQQATYTYKACLPGTGQRIALYVKEGMGIRSISRVLGISPTTVIGQIKGVAATLRPPPPKAGRAYELDELATYVGNKSNRVYVAYALDRKSRAVAGLVVGRRNKANLRQVVDPVVHADARRITTDGLDLYGYLVPPGIHRVKGFGINRIERNNLTLRTQLKRLGRRTLCYSKSIVMLHACVAIACWG